MKTILVVDDERNIVELVRLYLEKEGFAVVSARDGQSALELVERHDPDLVVLDLMLPGMDGLEVTRALRKLAEAHGGRAFADNLAGGGARIGVVLPVSPPPPEDRPMPEPVPA